MTHSGKSFRYYHILFHKHAKLVQSTSNHIHDLGTGKNFKVLCCAKVIDSTCLSFAILKHKISCVPLIVSQINCRRSIFKIVQYIFMFLSVLNVLCAG